MTSSRTAQGSIDPVVVGLLTGLILLLCAPSTTVAQEGDVTEGRAVFFARCVSCHQYPSDEAGLTEIQVARNRSSLPKEGPSLVGLLGRKAGSLPGYSYSDAMKASGLTWTEDTLRSYLLKPKEVVPRNKMLFNGIRRAGEIEDLMAYLMDALQIAR